MFPRHPVWSARTLHWFQFPAVRVTFACPGTGLLLASKAGTTVQNPGVLPENVAAPPGVGDDRLLRRKRFLAGDAKNPGFEGDLKTNVKGDVPRCD